MCSVPYHEPFPASSFEPVAHRTDQQSVHFPSLVFTCYRKIAVVLAVAEACKIVDC